MWAPPSSDGPQPPLTGQYSTAQVPTTNAVGGFAAPPAQHQPPFAPPYPQMPYPHHAFGHPHPPQQPYPASSPPFTMYAPPGPPPMHGPPSGSYPVPWPYPPPTPFASSDWTQPAPPPPPPPPPPAARETPDAVKERGRTASKPATPPPTSAPPPPMPRIGDAPVVRIGGPRATVPPPPFGSRGRPEKYRTSLCRHEKSGGVDLCPMGLHCRFAHAPEELRTEAQNVAEGLTTEAALRAYFEARARGMTTAAAGGADTTAARRDGGTNSSAASNVAGAGPASLSSSGNASPTQHRLVETPTTHGAAATRDERSASVPVSPTTQP
uniref:C3H1-type domain-containing protein n=1 Tax=Neobodo designis TaxID=312471 RepID=A0A7S1Q328_NEODS|mmetsp:Transcript_297/g.1150  ORF Transcript_297/g.1150 Transcript_297/m.1150 type:complete len:324 (+) Transcript_297:337-1308(+)